MKGRVLLAVLAILLAGLGLQGSKAPAVSAAPCAFDVSGISPGIGFVAGGATATISGCGFQDPGTLTVAFGAILPVITVVPASNTSLTVTTPAAAGPGAVTVTVRLHPSTGSDSVGTAAFTYVSPPSIATISPRSGPEAGGTAVRVKGTGFTQAGATTAVKFGAAAAAAVADLSSTALTATSPAGTGTQDVTVVVTLPGGASATSNGRPFDYVPAPAVTCVSLESAPACTVPAPSSGPVAGGTDVIVTGTHFQPGAHVLFGPADGSVNLDGDATGTPASVLSATEILVTTPAGVVGATNVVVVNPDGQSGALGSSSPNAFSYTGTAPSISTVVAATGTSLGGLSVTITGAGFLPSASVTFGTAAGTGVAVSADGTQITATTPAHAAGAVDVVVTNPGGGKATKAGAYTFVAAPAPTIASLTVSTGTSLGGTATTITGTNLAAGTLVSFGGTAAPSAAVTNSTTILAVTPAHAAGAVEVRVTLPDGQSAALAAGFTFTAAAAPAVTSVTPNTGPGGTEITIAGSGFAAGAVVAVGTAPCVPGQYVHPDTTCLETVGNLPVVRSGTSIVGLVPNAPGGAATVTVTNPDGQTATGAFTYPATVAPVLTAIAPATGNTLGHTHVTLTGTDFARGARVRFGPPGKGVEGTVTSVSADGTTIEAYTPGGVYGSVDVTVVNPDPGHDPSLLTTSLNDGFAFTAAPQPTILSITPSTGPSGTTVTIKGTGFANTNGASQNAVAAASVTVGGQQVLSLPPADNPPPVVVDSTTITALVPTASGGAADVAVVNPDGQGAILVGGYTYPTDTTAPVTVASGTVGGASYTFGTWAKGQVTVTLTATDTGAGVKDIAMSSTGAQTTLESKVPGSTRTAAFTVQGKTTITYFASDIEGNVESPKPTREVWVDSVAPAVTAAATIPSGAGTAPYVAGAATNADVTVTFSCTDGVSGVSTLTYVSGSTTTSSGTNPLSVVVSSSGANQSVTGTCTDAAGNAKSSTFGGINITRTAPSIDVTATIAGGAPYTAGVWTNRTVTVTFTCTPIPDGPRITTLTLPVQVDGPTHDHTVSGTCTDSAGNSVTATFGTAAAGIDIDRTLPIATATATTTSNAAATVPYTAGAWTNHDVVVTFHCTDAGANQSGVAAIDPPATVGAAGETSGVVGGCRDVAGNTANPPAFFGPILIDKAAPVCSVVVTPNPVKYGSKLVSVWATVTLTDGASGANGTVLVSVTSNNPATAAGDIVGFTVGAASYTGQLRPTKGRAYTFTYRGVDVAGNASAPCSVLVPVR